MRFCCKEPFDIHLSVSLFSHSCDTETTFCLQSKPNDTATVGRHLHIHTSYTCLCNIGYYVPNQTLQGFEGIDIESQAGNYSCQRCPGGCMHCDSKGECSDGDTQEYFLTETLLRFSIGVILGSCMFSCLILAIIVFRQRKCKVQLPLNSMQHLFQLHKMSPIKAAETGRYTINFRALVRACPSYFHTLISLSRHHFSLILDHLNGHVDRFRNNFIRNPFNVCIGE